MGVMGSVLSYCLFYFLFASWTLAEMAEPVSVVILVIYSACQSSDFYISPLLPPWVGQVVWGLNPSLRPGLLWGNNLDRARGIFNDQRHSDVYVVCLGGSIAVCVPLPEDVGREGCNSALFEGVTGPGVAFGIRVGADLSSHFLRKQQFLSVIILIHQLWFSIVDLVGPRWFLLWLSGLWIACVTSL